MLKGQVTAGIDGTHVLWLLPSLDVKVQLQKHVELCMADDCITGTLFEHS